MRAGLALIAGLLLSVAPAAAQGKTKTLPGVAALELCEIFATGDVLAVEAAQERGWDAYAQESESPFVRSYAASRMIAGLGYADLFALVESYPNSTFGYCRIDVSEMTGDGAAQVQAIQNLGRYEGQTIQNGEGSFASLTGADGGHERLLLAHAADMSFVIQLSVTMPRTTTNQ